MSGNRTAITVLVALALVLSALATPALADSHDGFGEDTVIDSLFNDEDEVDDTGGIADLTAFASGLWERLFPEGSEADAETYASRTAESLEGNSGTILAWVNERANATTDHDAIKVTFTDEDDGKEPIYLVADVNSTAGDYQNGTVLNRSEWVSEDRAADLKVELGPRASRNAKIELETFVEDYAEPNNDLESSYIMHMAGEYAGQVSGDIPGSSEL